MSELKCSVKKDGEIAILTFDGSVHLRIDGDIYKVGSADTVLKDSGKEQLDSGFKNLVIDLAKVSAIDSTGIGELVGLATSARKQGGEIRLASVTKKIKDIMEIVRLNTVFSCYESVDEAVQSFKS